MKMTHKHDVYFSPHSTEAYNLVMQMADYCNKRGIWYKISESTLGIGIVYGGNVGYVIEADRKTEPNNSEKPNNCEHITEDGVTCAKYPACDDCLDNPLNKLKGSERLVKGSEQTEPTISKMEQVEGETQRDCTEALTLLWIKRMVTDEEFYRIDARLKVMPQTERSE